MSRYTTPAYDDSKSSSTATCSRLFYGMVSRKIKAAYLKAILNNQKLYLNCPRFKGGAR